MATNILKAGHELVVFDLDRAATASLEARGAMRATDVPALAAEVEGSWRPWCPAAPRDVDCSTEQKPAASSSTSVRSVR